MTAQPEEVFVAKLDDLLGRFAGWEITRRRVWTAERRATATMVEIHCARSLAELEAKLERAEG